MINLCSIRVSSVAYSIPSIASQLEYESFKLDRFTAEVDE